MTLSGRARTALSLALLALFAAAGVLAGAALGRVLTHQGTRTLALDDPALFDAPPSWAQRSPGGFTGFGAAPALGGVVLRSGAIAAGGATGASGGATGATRLVIDSPGARTTVELTQPLRLYRIERATRPPTPGEVATVRLVGGRPVAVLLGE